MALAGAAGIVWPTRRLYRKSRRRALVMLLTGVALAQGVRLITPSSQTSTERHGIDEFTPVFQFREYHETAVAAPPERVFDAIKTVNANEIGLFRAFTWIRRFGQDGPESIMNPPDDQPILDVAVRTGFLLLQDRSPHEVVVGTVLLTPRGVSRKEFSTPDHFKQISQPGFAIAAMNFRVEPTGAGTSRVITETRVFGTDRQSVRVFARYWRAIFPGSAILRMTWLRAIKAKAEGPRP